MRYIIVENLAPMVREMEIYMEKNEIVGYEPLVNDLKQLMIALRYSLLVYWLPLRCEEWLRAASDKLCGLQKGV